MPASQVPFYRDRLQAAGLEAADLARLSELERIPIATRAELRAAFPERIVAENVSRRRRDFTHRPLHG